MISRTLAIIALVLLASPALAAQPSDGVYICARGDAVIGDIEITGASYRARADGGEFGAAADYIMLDEVSLYWLTDPEILTVGGTRVDNTKITDAGFAVTVLADGASAFETVTCELAR